VDAPTEIPAEPSIAPTRTITITAPTRLDAASAHPFRLAVLDAMQRTATLTIDLSQVVTLDAAGAAVLVGASRRATSTGRRMALASPSAAALDTFASHGLAQWLSPRQPAAT
jgi:anti-anti-sigma factor